jgi:hypothetical protein
METAPLTEAEKRAIDWEVCMKFLDKLGVPREVDGVENGPTKLSLYSRLRLWMED